MALKPLIAANWKMHGRQDWASKPGYLAGLLAGQGRTLPDVLFCPPALYVQSLAAAASQHGFYVGAQHCHPAESGAHTGDISAGMIKDCGAEYVIAGHSERRADHGETDADVRAQSEAAQKAGIVPIICVGESRAQREAGEAEAVVGLQLAQSVPDEATAQTIVIAYEPIWAIGTGLVPSLDDIQAMHGFIRAQLDARFGPAAAGLRILYGGSVKPANAQDILAISNVGGALVGGASLEMESFAQIVLAA